MTNVIGIKILGEYEMSMDDVDGMDWMTGELSKAARSGEIDDYSVLTSLTDATGTQLILFIVDKAFGWAFSEDQTQEQAHHTATSLLNEVLHDTSVNVRWLAPLEA